MNLIGSNIKTLFVVLFLTLSLPVISQTNVPSGSFKWDEAFIKKVKKAEYRTFVTGSTLEFDKFELSALTVLKGKSSKLTFLENDFEQLIFVKSGILKSTSGNKSELLKPGSVLLIPPVHKLLVENINKGVVSFDVLKFRSKKSLSNEKPLIDGSILTYSSDSLKYISTARGGRVNYFEKPTAMCDNLEIHITQLNSKGPSHAPHSHIDTEMILVIEGETEMIIKDQLFKASAGDIYLMNSNELHGISNVQNKPCKYFAVRWK
jgi:quercetin dioxygenase-like cupin family protein